MGTHAVSSATQEVLRSLDALSSHGLARRDDLGVLLEAAARSGRYDVLDRLSFEAKFVSQSTRMLEHLDTVPQGIERLQKELSASLDRVGNFVRTLVQPLDEDERIRLEKEYLTLQPAVIKNLITLCHDLRWYKNLQIDHSRGAPSRPHTRRPS